MNNVQKLLFSRITRIKVCSNNQGKGGNEAGIILMNNIEHLSDDEKSELVVASGLHELAFIQEEDNQNYQARFFNGDQEIGICGHLSLAIGDLLKTNREDEITLHANNNLKIGLKYKNRIPFVKIDKPIKGNIKRTGSDTYHDMTQDKEVILRDSVDEIADDLENRAVMFASEISKNVYKTRFFRNGKEDPFHMSGLVPLAEILGVKKATFESGNKGLATLVDDGESYLLTGNCINLSKQRTSKL